MKTKRFLLLLVMLLLMAFAPIKTTRFVSAWVWLPAESTLTIAHSLGIRPLQVEGWLAFPVANTQKPNLEIAYPLENSQDVTLEAVSAEVFYLSNQGDTGIFVQIVGDP